jgi:hypothetical protein
MTTEISKEIIRIDKKGPVAFSKGSNTGFNKVSKNDILFGYALFVFIYNCYGLGNIK